MAREHKHDYGTLRIGKIESIDTPSQLAEVSFEGSYSSASAVPFSVHPLLGIMPSVGSMVAVYDRPGFGKRILMSLYESEGLTVEELQTRNSKAGLHPNMQENEIFIGRHGRAYFDNQGNVQITCQQDRAAVSLLYDESRAELSGYYFDIYSLGKNVRVRSKKFIPAVPGTPAWGDSLFLEVNTPIPPGIASAAEVIPTTLGRMSISNLGSINLDSLPLGGPLNCNLEMDVTGLISLGRGFPLKTVGLTMGTLDGVLLFNNYGYLSIAGTELAAPGEVELKSYPGKSKLNFSPIGDILLTNTFGSMGVDAVTGQVNLSSIGGNLELRQDGSVGIFPNSLSYGFGINAAGDLAFGGKSVDISGTTTARLAGAASASIEGLYIKLGLVSGGHVAIAEKLDLIFKQLAILHQKIQAHTHTGTITSGAQVGNTVAVLLSPELVSAAYPPVNSALIGSVTVTAQP